MTAIDPELSAMTVVVGALTPLDEAARSRVLKYAAARFSAVVPSAKSEDTFHEALSEPVADKTITSFSEVAELYHAVRPSTDAEKALAVSAWMQQAEVRDGIDSYSVNTALKHLGYPIGNITRAFDALITQRPALMIQLRKGGTSKQARKLFRVTDAGLKRVSEMIRMTGTGS